MRYHVTSCKYVRRILQVVLEDAHHVENVLLILFYSFLLRVSFNLILWRSDFSIFLLFFIFSLFFVIFISIFLIPASLIDLFVKIVVLAILLVVLSLNSYLKCLLNLHLFIIVVLLLNVITILFKFVIV